MSSLLRSFTSSAPTAMCVIVSAATGAATGAAITKRRRHSSQQARGQGAALQRCSNVLQHCSSVLPKKCSIGESLRPVPPAPCPVKAVS